MRMMLESGQEKSKLDVTQIKLGQTEFNKALLSTCGYLTEGTQVPIGCNVVFVVEDRKFFASKAIITARSQYFAKMLNSSMKEAKTQEIHLKEVDPEVFWIVLQFLTAGCADHVPVDPDVMLQIFMYCDLIQFSELSKQVQVQFSQFTRNLIAQVANNQIISILNNLCELQRFDLAPQLKDYVLQYAYVFFDSPELYLNFDESTIKHLLKNPMLACRDEDILLFVIAWCKHHGTTINEFKDDIWWESIPIKQVINAIDTHKLLDTEKSWQLVKELAQQNEKDLKDDKKRFWVDKQTILSEFKIIKHFTKSIVAHVRELIFTVKYDYTLNSFPPLSLLKVGESYCRISLKLSTQKDLYVYYYALNANVSFQIQIFTQNSSINKTEVLEINEPHKEKKKLVIPKLNMFAYELINFKVTIKAY